MIVTERKKYSVRNYDCNHVIALLKMPQRNISFLETTFNDELASGWILNCASVTDSRYYESFGFST